MKRLFATFCAMLAAIFSVTFFFKAPKITPAFAAAAEYGLIGENVILYNSEMQAITSLPATYFVTITDENEGYYAVNYNDLSGFVEKIRVFKINYEPKLKYASGFFTADNDTHSVIIRSSPSSNSVAVSEIPNNGKAYYYGYLTGEALIPAAGNIWYYVKYNDGETRYGYVYSAQGEADTFVVNSGEKMPEDSTPITSDPKDDTLPDWVFILLLCVPAIVIMLALFGRGSRKEQNNNHTNQS